MTLTVNVKACGAVTYLWKKEKFQLTELTKLTEYTLKIKHKTYNFWKEKANFLAGTLAIEKWGAKPSFLNL